MQNRMGNPKKGHQTLPMSQAKALVTKHHYEEAREVKVKNAINTCKHKTAPPPPQITVI
jgi:hypothetical protein